ncbi:MAG: hypothetical protein Q8T11_08500 [Elusimicrobiota bacterium]|nr:hypothetical protein [Elusimicrobiota bacterium]
MIELATLLLAVTAATFVAAPSAAAAAPAPHAKPYWLKTYSQTPYRETWRGELTVKKLDEALPKVVAAVEGGGGRLVQPLENFVRSASEQQLSLVVPLKNSKALLKALRKLGQSADPSVRPYAPPVPLDEVREKLSALKKEKEEKWGALAQTPVAAAAVDELIEHLTAVEAAARSVEPEVLWNLTVKEGR